MHPRGDLVAPRSARTKHRVDSSCNLMSHPRWNRVANLAELGAAGTFEEIVVGERLEACRFSYGNAPQLSCFRMDEIVAILREVACHRGAGTVPSLCFKPIHEASAFPAAVVGMERAWELLGTPWRSIMDSRERSGVGISLQVVFHVGTDFMIE